MIAVTFALPDESREFRSRLHHAGRDGMALLGNLGDVEVAVFHTGMGAGRVHERLPALFRQHPVRAVLAAGYAGGLEPSLGAGEVILGYNVSDPALLAWGKERLGCRSVRLASAPEPVEDPEEKVALFRRTAAAAVDLETEAIAALCREREIPMLAVRAISDTATETLPVPFNVCFDAQAERPRVGALLRFLARHPARLPAFLQWVGRVHTARTALADALERLAEAGGKSNPPRAPR